MAKLQADLEHLKKEKKKLEKEQSNEERKKRTHRLCKRGGELEKLFPDLITLTEEQFYLFVEKTLLTGFAERILGEIVSGKLKPTPQGETTPPKIEKPTTEKQDETPPPDGEKPAPKATETQGHTNAPPPPKPANTAHNGGTGGRANEGDNERRNG
jgi:hypothetical protein